MTSPAMLVDHEIGNRSHSDHQYSKYTEVEDDCAFDNHMDSLVHGGASQHKRQLWEKYYEQLKQQMESDVRQSGGLRSLTHKRYSLEKQDSQHRTFWLLFGSLGVYRNVKPPQPFFEWLNSLGEFGVISMLRSSFSMEKEKNIFGHRADEHRHVLPSQVKKLLQHVAYLDAQARVRYRVVMQNGLLQKDGKPLDTTNMKTHFTGPGWAIYVLSPSGVFYTGSHVVGQFHHSSFLEGRPVKGAGEWKVNNGKLIEITAKSGHYKPKKEHFINCLKSLRPFLAQHGTKAVVFPKRTGVKEPIRIDAEKFLSESDKYEVWLEKYQ